MISKDLPIFYCTDFNNQYAYLCEEEALHVSKVLRLRKGAKVNLIDGKGGVYEGTLENENQRKVTIKINKSVKLEQNNNRYLHIAVVPTKNSNRMEWMVEKAVEIGVQEISFFYSQRAERKKINLQRIEKIAIAALKQSHNFFLPRIQQFQNMHRMLDYLVLNNQKIFIAHLLDDTRKNLSISLDFEKKNCILIGPEGDFTKDELNLALNKNAIPVYLSENRFRTETAAVFVCAQFEINYQLYKIKKYGQEFFSNE